MESPSVPHFPSIKRWRDIETSKALRSQHNIMLPFHRSKDGETLRRPAYRPESEYFLSFHRSKDGETLRLVAAALCVVAWLSAFHRSKDGETLRPRIAPHGKIHQEILSIDQKMERH